MQQFAKLVSVIYPRHPRYYFKHAGTWLYFSTKSQHSKKFSQLSTSEFYISLADRANISLAPWQRTLTVYNSVAKPAVAAYLKVSEKTTWTKKPQKLKQGSSYFLNLLDHDFFSTLRFSQLRDFAESNFPLLSKRYRPPGCRIHVRIY